MKTLPSSSSNCLLLNYMVDIRRFDYNRQQILNGMCKSRYLERDLAYEHFYLALPFIVEAMEIINGNQDIFKRSTQKVGIIKQNGKQVVVKCSYFF